MARELEKVVTSKELTTLPPTPTPPLWLRLFTHNLFSHLKINEDWVNLLINIKDKGKLVFVHRLLNIIDFWALDFLTKKYNLPTINFIGGIGFRTVRPLKWFFLFLLNKYRPLKSEELLYKVITTESKDIASMIFLKKANGIFRHSIKDLKPDYIELLLNIQKKLPTPIYLIPQMFIWGRRIPQGEEGVIDKVIGTREWPGVLRGIAQFLRSYRDARLVYNEPINLKEYIESNPDLNLQELATQLKFKILNQFEKERRIALGPLAKSPEKLISEVLNYPELQDTISELSEKEKKPLPILYKKSKKILKEIAARQSIYYLTGLDAVCWWIWNKIFDGVEIDEEGLEKVKKAAKEGTLILLPTHKSHVDYLIISQIFFMKGLIPPHIAAGKNLSFWPIGRIFRGCGAFFIRRSFKGDNLYTAILKGYLKKLIQEGYPIEFFIEGGRSRSGKVLNPKFGMLSMIFDIGLSLKGRKLFFCPISVTYERVIEDNSYKKELEGGEKKSENLQAIIKARHTLNSKYGRINVQFATPFSLDQFLNENSYKIDTEIKEEEKKLLINKLGYRITYELNKVTAINPTAIVSAALLSHFTKGVQLTVLKEDANWLYYHLRNWNARFNSVLTETNYLEIPEKIIEQTLSLLEKGGIIKVYGTGDDKIITVEEQNRLQLDYYKNHLIHFFAPYGILSATIFYLKNNGVIPIEELELPVKELSRLLKYEFSFQYGQSIKENMMNVIYYMEKNGYITVEDNKILVQKPTILLKYARLIDNFVEGYYTVLYSLEELLNKSKNNKFSDKEFINHGLSSGYKLFLIGKIKKLEARNKTILSNGLNVCCDMSIVERLSSRENYYKFKNEADSSVNYYKKFLYNILTSLDKIN